MKIFIKVADGIEKHWNPCHYSAIQSLMVASLKINENLIQNYGKLNFSKCAAGMRQA